MNGAGVMTDSYPQVDAGGAATAHGKANSQQTCRAVTCHNIKMKAPQPALRHKDGLTPCPIAYPAALSYLLSCVLS